MKGHPTLWDVEEEEPTYGATSTDELPPDYPWRYLECLEAQKARGVHPALAAILAEEQVAREEAAAIRRDRLLRPQLWDTPVYTTKAVDAA